MPPKQKSEPINLSIRTNAMNDTNILTCFHDDINAATISNIIEYLKCGVKLYLEELKKILNAHPYNMSGDDITSFLNNLSKEFEESKDTLLKLFAELIKSNLPGSTFSIPVGLEELLKQLKLALELDIKHDHGGTRGHGVGKECVQFISDNGTLLSGLNGVTPLEIIINNGNAALLSKNVDGTITKICLDENDDLTKFPPLYKILDTTSKKCVKKYLKKAQIIKCLPTIIDSAGQADKVGEPPDFDILFELIVQNFGELLFSSMFKSLVDNNIYLFTFLPPLKSHTRDEWLKNTKSYVMRVFLTDVRCSNVKVSKDIIVNTGQASQFSVPKITMFNSRTLLEYLKSPGSIYRMANMANIWSALCKTWDPTVTSFPNIVNEKHINSNEVTKKKAEVLVRDLQYVKKICGDGCQNFATLVYSNLKSFFKYDGTKYGFYPDTKGYFKNTTTETFDTFLAVVSSVLGSSYSIGTTSMEFQYTMGDRYARFYKKSYIEVWRLFSTSYPLLLFEVSDSDIYQGKGGHNNIKYNYISESSDYSDYSDYSDDDNRLSNEFYNKLLLNYKNKKGGMDGDKAKSEVEEVEEEEEEGEAGDEEEEVGRLSGTKRKKENVPKSKKETELKKEICLQKLNYEEVYKLNQKFWTVLENDLYNSPLIKLVQFIFTHINKGEHLEKFLFYEIPSLVSTLNEIAIFSEKSHSLKKKAEISDLMLKRAATGIQIDTNAFKTKYDGDLRLNKYQSEITELVLGNVVKESFFDVVEDIYGVDEYIPKKILGQNVKN